MLLFIVVELEWFHRWNGGQCSLKVPSRFPQGSLYYHFTVRQQTGPNRRTSVCQQGGAPIFNVQELGNFARAPPVGHP